jgi:hypothetical protein
MYELASHRPSGSQKEKPVAVHARVMRPHSAGESSLSTTQPSIPNSARSTRSVGVGGVGSSSFLAGASGASSFSLTKKRSCAAIPYQLAAAAHK